MCGHWYAGGQLWIAIGCLPASPSARRCYSEFGMLPGYRVAAAAPTVWVIRTIRPSRRGLRHPYESADTLATQP